MARRPRVLVPNMPVHVVQRGNNRQACFFQAKDYAVYLKKLEECAEKFNVLIHCFVLMTNHVHLLLQASDYEKLLEVLQTIHPTAIINQNGTINTTFINWRKVQQYIQDEYVHSV